MTSLPKSISYPKSAPGDFYVESGQCMACGMPHVVAPDLIGWDKAESDKTLPHCYWKKQPQTGAELDRAIAVLETQELGCHRYAGTNPAILNRVSPSYCDYPTSEQVESSGKPGTVPAGPHFLLLDSRPGLLSRAWSKLVKRR